MQDALPWEYPNDALVTVCALCHSKLEFIKWIRKTIEYSLFENRFTTADINEVRELIIIRVMSNKHRESCEAYMNNLKSLLNG